MINKEQIKWLLPVYQQINDILDLIPGFNANFKCPVMSAEHLKGMPNRYDYCYDEEKGLYKILYLERDDTHIEIYGKTKKEIVQRIVNRCIVNEAYESYAIQEQRKKCLMCNPAIMSYKNQYIDCAQERVDYCYLFVDKFIEAIEDSVFPPSPTESRIREISPLKEYNYLALRKECNKTFVSALVEYIHYYSHCELYLYKEDGNLLQSFPINRVASEFDISTLFDKIKNMSLVADNIVLENLQVMGRNSI